MKSLPRFSLQLSWKCTYKSTRCCPVSRESSYRASPTTLQCCKLQTGTDRKRRCWKENWM